MGAAESVVRNVDKRTARREHREKFIDAIHMFADRFDYRARDGALADDASDRPIRVCVRKRPMFDHEWKKEKEFDVVTAGQDRVVVHDARMAKDMQKMFIDQNEMNFDRVFGEAADNDEVYSGTAARLVQLAADGGHATVMMYGQTGSGKTYTMSSIYERAAEDLFKILADDASVSVSFVELAGEVCRDMLNEGGSATIATGRNGEVHPTPVTEVRVQSPADLIAFVDHATSLRATSATAVHDASSRSHAVCRIYVERQGGRGQEGCLTLVDLAGSEHKIDSMYHDAQRRKEGAQINSSLMALKEILRARVKNKDPSFLYRKSKLTQLLKTSFCVPEARTVVIATVSPSSKDTEHSLNTLRHACIMDGQGDRSAGQGPAGQGAFITGGTTTRLECGEIDVAKIARDRREKGPQKDLRGGGRGAYKTGQWSAAPELGSGNSSATGGAFDDNGMAKKRAEKAKAMERHKMERDAMRRLPRGTSPARSLRPRCNLTEEPP